MLDVVDRFSGRLVQADGIDGCLDLLLDAVQELGFSSVIYDFCPVPRSHAGVMIVPNVMRTRNVPDGFVELWCRGGYYRIDPVQQVCLDCSIPFVWSHFRNDSRILERPLRREHAPVVSYLKDTRLTCGATVPIHRTDGALATVTAVRIDSDSGFVGEARQRLGTLSMLAQHLHGAVYERLDGRGRRSVAVNLTEREIECLRWAAEGKTAQDIAVILDRSLATICLHLGNAARKLGAQNRAQAIARAAHYRLLGPN
ncbi:MAG: LuxR family transcriptional regulator [Dongiaceae bacterium]